MSSYKSSRRTADEEYYDEDDRGSDNGNGNAHASSNATHKDADNWKSIGNRHMASKVSS